MVWFAIYIGYFDPYCIGVQKFNDLFEVACIQDVKNFESNSRPIYNMPINLFIRQSKPRAPLILYYGFCRKYRNPNYTTTLVGDMLRYKKARLDLNYAIIPHTTYIGHNPPIYNKVNSSIRKFCDKAVSDMPEEKRRLSFYNINTINLVIEGQTISNLPYYGYIGMEVLCKLLRVYPIWFVVSFYICLPPRWLKAVIKGFDRTITHYVTTYFRSAGYSPSGFLTYKIVYAHYKEMCRRGICHS